MVTNCVCPQLATFLPADMYSDYTRVADPVWQRRDSFFWSAGPDEEKAAAAKAVASLVRTGHIEQHLAAHAKGRTCTGRTGWYRM